MRNVNQGADSRICLRDQHVCLENTRQRDKGNATFEDSSSDQLRRLHAALGRQYRHADVNTRTLRS